MKAVVVTDNGDADKSVLSETATPNPGAGDIRVSVAVAGLNYLDIYQRNGAVSAPFNAGVEGVGRVDAVGEGVDSSWVGQRVGWLAGQGSFAESVVLPAEKAVPIPDDISDDHAVALLMQGLTAHYLAKSVVSITSNSTILVHSAAGGVGRLLVQLARHLGATVIATASSQDKRALALDAGAHHAIGYDDFAAAVADLTGGTGVDVIVDGVGKDTVVQDLEALAVRGTLIMTGAASGPPAPVEFATLATKSLSVIRPSIAHFTARSGELAWRAAEVFDLARIGVLTTRIAGRYPLAEVAEGQRALTSRSLAGKIVIDVAGRPGGNV